MTDPFRRQIHIALQNPNLQAALDGNATRRNRARQQAYTSLPEDLQILRQRAHALRAYTIAHLDSLLEQFIVNAEANGMIVHRTASATEAVRLVLEIAGNSGAHLIAKSKTMVGEEIELNPALEAAGLKVVETDLGEYIVQLRNERPAHIITPAVHLRKADVARTFSEKLKVPYNEDIPTMTKIARQILRQTFLDADIGVSGVNFGVAESGTLCLVTNEGNGRMVTTLPPMHIALMGIERLAPTLEDLALLLQLLPRSATGQKLTVYTSLINGPRRSGDADGSEERHLILVDNGRQRLRGSALEEALYCIRCGACLNACPVFRQLGGHAYVGIHGQTTAYPGPIGSVLSPGLFGASDFGNLARATSLCGACKEACPVDIDLPKLLLRVRAGLTPEKPPEATAKPVAVPTSLNAGLRLYSWVARSPGHYHLAQRLAGWFGSIAARSSGWLRLPAFTGWGLSRDFPRPAAQTFRQRFANRTAQETRHVQTPALPTTQTESTPSTETTPIPASAPGFSHKDRFQKELVALGGQYSECTHDQLADLVSALLANRGVECLSAWEGQYLPDGLLEKLGSAGIEITHSSDSTAQAGLTGAIAGIADTGSIVLVGGEGRPLSASLLPQMHVAILSADKIYPDMAQLFGSQNPARQEIQEAPAAVIISGPSRTSDIEMTLTVGVHGPGEVHVFCVA
jgi:L-lactate dehydrogenase complex protein LldF